MKHVPLAREPSFQVAGDPTALPYLYYFYIDMCVYREYHTYHICKNATHTIFTCICVRLYFVNAVSRAQWYGAKDTCCGKKMCYFFLIEEFFFSLIYDSFHSAASRPFSLSLLLSFSLSLSLLDNCQLSIMPFPGSGSRQKGKLS